MKIKNIVIRQNVEINTNVVEKTLWAFSDIYFMYTFQNSSYYLISGKGSSVAGDSSISWYMEEFGEEKMCETVKSILSLMDPLLFPELVL